MGSAPPWTTPAWPNRSKCRPSTPAISSASATRSSASAATNRPPIPSSFDYDKVRGLSAEVLLKLKRALPETVGQAARISGVTPAAISLLLVHLKRRDAA